MHVLQEPAARIRGGLWLSWKMHPREGVRTGQLLLGLLCGLEGAALSLAGGSIPAWHTRREGEPSEPAQGGTGALSCSPLTAQAHRDKHNLLPGAQGGDSTIPSDKGHLKVIPWESSKAPGSSRC